MDLEVKNVDHRSVSSMMNFCRCKRKYFWAKQCGLEAPSPQRDLAMRFGSAIHAGVPFTHTGSHRDFDSAMSAFAAEWGDGDEFQDKKRNTRTGRNVLLDLMQLHGDSFPLQMVEMEVQSESDGKKTLHEVTAKVDFGLASGKHVEMRVDGIGADKTTGALSLVEYKTTSQLWQTFGSIWTLNPQIETYCTGLILAGMAITGSIVEGLLVAAGKTEVSVVPVSMIEDTMNGCLEWWCRNDRELSQLEAEAEANPLRWPMAREACTPYPCFGLQGFVCEFQPLCMAGGKWQGLLGMFQVKEQKKEKEAESE